MRWRVMMTVLTSVALAGGLLATDAHARAGGGRGGSAGHMGASGGARVERAGGGRMAGIPRGAVENGAGTGSGTGTRYETGNRYGTGLGHGAGIRYGTGIRYGRGILRDRYLVFAASARGQTATPDSSTGGSVSPPAPPIGGPSPETASGPGLTIVGADSVSTKPAGMAPASSASASSGTHEPPAPAFAKGSLVRLRSGGPLMTVKGIKDDQVDCFWTDLNGQINADSFPVDVLQKG